MSIAFPDTSEDKPGAKVELHSDLGERVVVETPWAFALGDGLYRLDNAPWYATAYSVADVVRCDERGDGLPVAVELAEPGGYRTARVLFSPLSLPETQDAVLDELERAGAGYEGTGAARHGFYAVSLDAGVDVAELLDAAPLEWELPGDRAFLARCEKATRTGNFTLSHADGRLMVDAGGHWERLAAEELGAGRWRITSIPLFAYDVFPDDVVEAPAADGEYPVMKGVVERSGRWVLRVIAKDADPEGLIAECEARGGTVERHPWNEEMFGVSVEGDDATQALRDHLEERERAGQLSYETGWS